MRQGNAVLDLKWTSISFHTECLLAFKAIMQRHRKVVYMEPYVHKNLNATDIAKLKQLTDHEHSTKRFTLHKF